MNEVYLVFTQYQIHTKLEIYATYFKGLLKVNKQ